jgi:uncharacterized membrane protein YgaE (UPF0421/DUF939 family)
MNLRTHTAGLQLALRTSLAAGVAMAIAALLALPHPIFAFISAVIVTDLAPARSRKLGMQRLAATLVGAVCGAALTQLLAPGASAIVLAILIAMLVCQLLGSFEGAKVAGFIAGIVVFEHSAQPWISAAFYFIESVLGIVCAMLISYVPKLIRLKEPSEQEQGAQG